ncbi:MAG: hypothetical protein EOP05_01105 [Proteobacteria bacterium]|nr:MAG: hypothetical protein EOP05_01105 [Pseudomonadota bacterium]
MPLYKIIISMLLFATTAQAVNRVGVKKLDIGEVETVYLAPGLITVMEFPEAITEVSTGAPQIYRLQISSVHKEELILQIQNSTPFKTNLIVRTTKQRYVFDMEPNLRKHQDVIQVREGYGQLKEDDEDEKLHQRRLAYEREMKRSGGGR